MKPRSAIRASSTEVLVAEVTDDFLERLHRGEQPEIEEYQKRYPEIASIIRRVFPALQIMRASTSGGGLPKGQTAADATVAGQLGDYRIVREVGRGGMGVVYEAVQVSLGRKVALKVLPFAAVLDQRQLQRFKNEAQAAAQLHHTNIVPVFSVGCERGVHYYAMQYIEGQTLAAVFAELSHICGLKDATSDEVARMTSDVTRTLTSGAWAPTIETVRAGGAAPAAEGSSGAVQALASEYSAKSPAFFRSIAQLGVQAAEALDHAHESGVIHRDIKPSNLLLDARGHLWITDFGLARLESEPGMTMTGDILGTVRYMSPEQALAKRIPIDHRTDIYSLGVTLYELLTLRPAFDGRDRQELLKQIAFEEPRQPRRVNRAIPTELETIVLKAFNKNPEQRYATAQDLADDLGRFLEDKPIKAKRPTLVQRAAKWSRRHRAVVGSGVVLLVLAVVCLSVSTTLIWQEQARTAEALASTRDARSHEAEQRQRAEENFRKARDAVDRMLTRVAEDLEDQPRMEQTRRALLEDAIEFYEGFLEERSDDPDVRSEAGRAYRRVGAINRLLGQDEQAEASYTQAVAMFEELVADFPDQADYQAELATACTHLGRLLGAKWNAGRAQDGEAPCRRALGIWEKLIAEFPDMPEYRGNLGNTLNDLGFVLECLGYVLESTAQYEEAGQVYREALAVFEELNADFPNEPEYRSGLALTHDYLGGNLNCTERRKDAEVEFRRAVELQQKLVEEFPAKREYQDRLTLYLSNLGSVLRGADQSQEAEELWPRALELQEQLVSDFPGVPHHWDRLFSLRHSLGRFLTDQKRLDEAERVYRGALETEQERAAENPDKPQYQWPPTYTLRSLLDVLGAAGKIDEATEEFQRALQSQEQLVSEYPEALEYREQLASLHFGFANTLSEVGRKEEAEQVYRQSLAIYENLEKLNASGALSAHPSDMAAIIHSNLGVIQWDTGREKDAETEFRRAVELSEKLVAEVPAKHEYQATLAYCGLCRLGWVLGRAGRYEEAIEVYRRAVELGEKLVAEVPAKPEYQDWLAFYPLSNLGSMLLRAGQFQEAAEVYRRAVVLEEKLVSDDPEKLNYREHLAYTHRWFADGLRDAGRIEEAEDVYRQTVAVPEQLCTDFPKKPEYRQELNNALRRLASFLAEAGEIDEATEKFEQAAQAQEELIADYPEAFEYREQFASMHFGFANTLRKVGRKEEAEQFYRQTLAILERLNTDLETESEFRSEYAAMTHNNLGFILEDTGREKDAEAEYRRAVELGEKLVAEFPAKPGHRDDLAFYYLRNLGRVLGGAGRSAEAEEVYRRALALHEKLVSEHPEVPGYRDHLAVTCQALRSMLNTAGKHAAAVELAERVVQLVPQKGEYWSTLGFARYRAGDWPGAVEAQRKSVEIGFLHGPDDDFFEAIVYWHEGDEDKAHERFDRGAQWMDHAEPDRTEYFSLRAEAAEVLNLLDVQRHAPILSAKDEPPMHVYRVLGDEPVQQAEATGGVQVTMEDVDGQTQAVVRAVETDVVCPYELTLRTATKSRTITGAIVPAVWDIQVFGYQADPVEDVEAWRREAAERHVETQVSELFLVYGDNGPGEVFDFDARIAEAGLPVDYFGTIATTEVTLPVGIWQLRSVADDGVRVWVDGELLIDIWRPHPPWLNTAELTVTEQRSVEIRVENFEKEELACLSLELWPTDKSLLPFAHEAWSQAESEGDLASFEKARSLYEQVVRLQPDEHMGYNNLAWFLATCSHPQFRDAPRAVELAERAVAITPSDGNLWNTLGTARYRNGDWPGAIEALNKSLELLGDEGKAYNCYFLAMAHWQLGDKELARNYHAQARDWMHDNAPGDWELRRFFVESTELLGGVPLWWVVPEFADQQKRSTRVYQVLGDEAPVSAEATGGVQVEIDTGSPQPRIIVWTESSGSVRPYELTVRTATRSATVRGALFAAEWDVEVFGYETDPLEDADAWRAEAAAEHVAFRMKGLFMPYGNDGPSQLVKFAPDVAEAGLPTDHFGTIATTEVTIPAGRWQLRAVSDDGVRVWVDGKLLIDSWTGRTVTLDTAELIYDETRSVEIRVEYFELELWAHLSIDLRPLGPDASVRGTDPQPAEENVEESQVNDPG